MSARLFSERGRWPLALGLALGLALTACRGERGKQGSPASSGSAHAGGPPPSSSALLRAELRRDPSGVSEEYLIASEPGRREAAVRSLARIRDERSFEPLVRALSDERPGVITWAAWGVGQLCGRREPEAVRRLVLRAATLGIQGASPQRDQALGAIALALGRCASDEAEQSLRAWLRLRPELSRAAALGLGQVARVRKHLDDATVAQLLDAAAQNSSALYFYPLESLPALGAAPRARLVEVGKLALERPDPNRAFAIRALAKAGPEGAALLGAVLLADTGNDSERADAARALGSLGAAGQTELRTALARRARRLLDDKAWLTSQHGVVLTLLEALEPESADAALLAELAELPLSHEPGPVARRKLMLRCRAASLLAGQASASARLLACDPGKPGDRREGELALLRVLGRGSLAGARGARFQSLARSEDRVVREAALELLMAHDEAPNIAELLTSALGSGQAGVRATAAKVLIRYPARAQLAAKVAPEAGPGKERSATPPIAPELVQALTAQLATIPASSDIEVSALLLDAAVALELLGAKPALERACSSSNPTLREHAERGLVALGDTRRRCPNVASQDELGLAPPASVRLELETDVGPLTLTLSGSDQPFASARLVELARAGFYDNMAIHRVVPGFVVQLGDPDGDGFGGASAPPLRCQLSPEPFEVGSVGIALAGRDTGSSQLFVALRRAPHLDGEYSLVGHAGPGWEKLAVGDRISKVRVLEGRSD